MTAKGWALKEQAGDGQCRTRRGGAGRRHRQHFVWRGYCRGQFRVKSVAVDGNAVRAHPLPFHLKAVAKVGMPQSSAGHPQADGRHSAVGNVLASLNEGGNAGAHILLRVRSGKLHADASLPARHHGETKGCHIHAKL